MVVVDMTAKNQLLLLAFALVESENNESWKWFLGLVQKQVLGPDRQVCMISDHHRGLLNGAKDHIEGYPPFIHKWCHVILPQTFGRSNKVRRLSWGWRRCARLKRRRNLRLDLRVGEDTKWWCKYLVVSVIAREI
jgi:hypothetical protein